MDLSTSIEQLETAVSQQVLLANNDEIIESASEAIMAALRPALRQALLELGEQAAAEISPQIGGHRVEVILQDGDPTFRVTPEEPDAPVADEDFGARISLRLPGRLKELIEESAADSGDSVNAWLVKAVAGSIGGRSGSRGTTRVTGWLET